MIDLSIIFPAYNESERLPTAINKVVEFFQHATSIRYEIIVVENGSIDDTYSVAIDCALAIARKPVHNVAIRIERSEPGKGSALRYGMKLAKGRYVLLTDVDLATPIREFPRLLAKIQSTGAGIAIGSRNLPGSVIVGRTKERQIAGRVFNGLTRILTPGIRDTQCGFKLIKKETIESVLSYLTLDGFAFDVELLRVALNHGYKIVEVPVLWEHDDRSTVRMIPDSLKMSLDLIKIGFNHAIGRYRR